MAEIYNHLISITKRFNFMRERFNFLKQESIFTLTLWLWI